MASVHPYLNFNGNTEEAFNFYLSVFGGEFTTLQRFENIPSDVPIPPGSNPDKIMHVALPIGKETVLMGSDVPESIPPVTMGTNFCISINAESEEDAQRLFNGLSAGGQVTMPLDKTFWGAYFGMFTDKFGIQWMVNYDYRQEK